MLTYRPITPQDRDYFMQLNNDKDNLYWMREDKEFTDDTFHKSLFNSNVKWYLILDVNFKRNTTTEVGLFTMYVKDNKLYCGIIIEDKYRKKGFARKAFRYMLGIVDKENLVTYIECFSDNVALSLYKKLGYKPTGLVENIRDREFITLKRKTLEF